MVRRLRDRRLRDRRQGIISIYSSDTPHPTPYTPHPAPRKNFLPQTLINNS
ncbi:MAG: hypothetical protein PX636_22410 [Microcystis sp. M53598_WE2]|nr:hypothetical protein [Microcystis sp. M53598_WE2]